MIERVLPLQTGESSEITVGRYPETTGLDGKSREPSICHEIALGVRRLTETDENGPVVF